MEHQPVPWVAIGEVRVGPERVALGVTTDGDKVPLRLCEQMLASVSRRRF